MGDFYQQQAFRDRMYYLSAGKEARKRLELYKQKTPYRETYEKSEK